MSDSIFAQESNEGNVNKNSRVLSVLERYDLNQDGRIDDFELQQGGHRRDRKEDAWDRQENDPDHKEEISDGLEDDRLKNNIRRDKAEDRRDGKEDRADHKESYRDRPEDRRNRKEDHRDSPRNQQYSRIHHHNLWLQ